MRRAILVVPVVLVLAACVHGAPRETMPPPEPLAVTLLPALAANTLVPSLTFSLNRPAYVAAFEIIPGRGIRLLYPYAPDSTRNPAGLNLVTETPSFSDNYLRSVLAVPGAGPVYTYVVASDVPLRLGTFTEPSGLRDYFGDAQFASFRASSLIDGVTAAVVPTDAPDDSWSSDLVTDWSNAPLAAFTLASTNIACGNGSFLTVPSGYGSTVCPADAVRAVRATILANTDAPHGSARVRGPTGVTTFATTPGKNGDKKAVKEPRRRPWWSGNPGRAWVGSLQTYQMDPVEETDARSVRSTTAGKAAARSTTPVRSASVPGTATRTATRTTTVHASPTPRVEIHRDAPRKP